MTGRFSVALEHRRMRRRAGRRARDKYRAQRRAWLRENRKVFAAIAAAFAVVIVGFHLLMAAWPGDQVWMSGFFAGALISALYGFRQTPPGIVERWQEGAWGEEMSAKELTQLARKGWTVLNDLPNGSFNFDHVVIGPSGVFCLNSKKSSRRLEILEDGKTARLHNPYDNAFAWDDQNLVRSAKRDAVALKELIERRTGQRLWIQPVIVWWGRFPQGGVDADGVGVVQGQQLIRALEQRRGRPVPDLEALLAAIKPGRREAPPRRWRTWRSRNPTRSRVGAQSGEVAARKQESA